MTKRQEICYGVAAAMVIAAAALVAQKPLWAIGAIAIGLLATRMAG